MDKKIVVLGGGSGLSVLLSGLKRFPLDITAIVTVSDNGRSTGKLRKEFNIPAVGDIRKVLVALSSTEEAVENLFDYRFKTTSDLDGHTVGNILLTAMYDITGNLSSSVKSLSNILNLRGKVLPLTDDNISLKAQMSDGSIIEGECEITESPLKIKKLFYNKKPYISKEVIDAIKSSDAIILSMGSIYTSIIPNLLSKDIIKAIDESDSKIMYVCNMMTQPGETDGFKVSDHINLLNSYLGKRKVDVVLTNKQRINIKTQKIYETKEQKDLVEVDIENIKCKVINKPLLKIENHIIRHDNMKLALEIITYLSK